MTGSNNRIIKGRHSIIDRVTGVKTNHILNASRNNLPNFSGRDAAGEIKIALDQFKTAAMDKNGNGVNYAVLRDSRAYYEFKRYCTPRLREFNPAELAADGERAAFWINLYNALVLDGIINLGIKRSVTETRMGIFTFFRKVAYNVGGQRVSLEDIEHGILRANCGFPYLPGAHFSSDDVRMGWAVHGLDARIHFALNCASRSCPPIRAYEASKIDLQLDTASRNFVDGNTRIDPKEKKLFTSNIFKWYKNDFGGNGGALDFILDHLPEDGRRRWIENHRDELIIKYEPYDWGLNTYIHPPVGR